MTPHAAFAAADLDELPADRAVARIIAVYLREGAKYAAAISQGGDCSDPEDVQSTIAPIRKVLDRGLRDRILREDLPGDALFEMFSAILERALWLTIGNVMTPEQAADAATTIFLDGARHPRPRPSVVKPDLGGHAR